MTPDFLKDMKDWLEKTQKDIASVLSTKKWEDCHIILMVEAPTIEQSDQIFDTLRRFVEVRFPFIRVSTKRR